MPKPYLIAVCRGSSLDQRNNNFTLFNLTENLQISKAPAPLPLEAHAYYEFAEDERGRDYELRLVLAPLGAGEEWQTQVFPVMTHGARHRVTLRGFVAPGFGDFRLFAEIRPRDGGDEGRWQRSHFGWPIAITQLEQAATPAVQPEAQRS